MLEKTKTARDAFNDMARQIANVTEKLRGHVKPHPPTLRGVIARKFNRDGFGFIESHGEEYYFSQGNVHEPFNHLKEGANVVFVPFDGKAHRVRLRKAA